MIAFQASGENLMTMNLGRSKKRAAEINVTPLVDVVLVLLIIFMVATPMIVRQLAAAVPRTEKGPPPAPGPLMVSYRSGVILLNHQPVTEEELVAKVHATLAREHNRVVLFDIDDDTAYAVAVHLMDVVRGAGAKTLALVTQN